MQQLQQLPKAEKLFKQYVDAQAEQLIRSSQNLSAKYLSERQQLIAKQRLNRSAIKELQGTIRLLGILVDTPFELRQSIGEVRGLETGEIQRMKRQYEQLLDNYNKEYSNIVDQESEAHFDSQGQELQNQKLQNQVKRLQFDGKEQKEGQKTNKRMKIVSYCLKSLEVITYAVCIVLIFYRFIF